jgi:cytochrome c oxidase assembly factor CtaG
MALTLGLAVITVAYAVAYRAARRAGLTVPSRWRASAYFVGVIALGLALLGPLDAWSEVLFSAHMVQHLLLMLVVPLLLGLGRPVQVLLRGLPSGARRAMLRQTFGRPAVRGLLATLVHPIGLAVLVNGSMAVWHVPTLYSAALRHPLVHELEHASFLATALLFWWALLGPELPHAQRLSTTASLLLVFATWMASDLLGATLTLASAPLYADYAATPRPWGLTALEDQRLGGLIMWVGGGVFYAIVMVVILISSSLWPRGRSQEPEARGHSPRRSVRMPPGALGATASERHA